MVKKTVTSQILGTLMGIVLSTTAIAGGIGSWQLHLPYNEAVKIDMNDEFVYVASSLSVFRFDRQDFSIERLDKVAGFSDIGISTIGIDEQTGIFIVAYGSSDIDLLLPDGSILNVSDIKTKIIPGDKSIYDIHCIDGFAYFATGFGIVEYDLINKRFGDTYKIGNDGDEIRIRAVTNDATHMYAATEEGLKRVDLNSVFPSNFSEWEQIGLSYDMPTIECRDVAFHDNQIFAQFDRALLGFDGATGDTVEFDSLWTIESMDVYGGHLWLSQWKDTGEVIDVRLTSYDPGTGFEYHTDFGMARPLTVLQDGNDIFVADLWQGLVIRSNDANQIIAPNGPRTSNVWKMVVSNNEVFVVPGAVSASFNFTFHPGEYYRMVDGWWNNIHQYNRPELAERNDVLDVAIDATNNKIYLASFLAGLVELGSEDITYGLDNSIIEAPQGDDRPKISEIHLEENGDVWMLNYGTAHPIVLKTADDQWAEFNPVVGVSDLKKIIQDDFGQLWISNRSGGILVYDPGDDKLSAGDDQSRLLSSGQTNGALHNTTIHDMANDLDGEIWVGTDEGIAIFYCAGSVLTSNGCDAQRVVVSRDGFNGFLFGEEVVRAIAVDGANRKWIGTNNGVWLISEDGREEILRFTIENSPLPSNQIVDIAINDATGEVFIGTELGLITYVGDATAASPTHQTVEVYPNPVRPEYSGPIAIKGLVEDAFVKITDVSGKLIFEDYALGGQAVWDGKDYTGREAASGFYIVYSTNPDGTEELLTKILVIR